MFNFKETSGSIISLQVRDANAVDRTTDDGVPVTEMMVTVRAAMLVQFDVLSENVLTSDAIAKALTQLSLAQDRADADGGQVETRVAIKGALCEGESVLYFRRKYTKPNGSDGSIPVRVVADFVGSPTIGVRNISTGTLKATVEMMVSQADLCTLASMVNNDRVTIEAEFKSAQEEISFAPAMIAREPEHEEECGCDSCDADAFLRENGATVIAPQFD